MAPGLDRWNNTDFFIVYFLGCLQLFFFFFLFFQRLLAAAAPPKMLLHASPLQLQAPAPPQLSEVASFLDFLTHAPSFFFSRFLKMSATSHPKHDSSKPNPFTNKEARIVIVGAGPAGKFRKRERKKENEKMKKKKMKFQEFQLGNFRGIHHKFT